MPPPRITGGADAAKEALAAANGLFLVNSAGVSLSHHFGGSTTQASLGCAQGNLVDNGRTLGTNAAKIASLGRDSSSCYFCLGNPKDWQGAWDMFQFDENQ